MATATEGGGYWLVASHGGVFSYGDARFYRSAGLTPVAQPVVGMASTLDGAGYRLIAAGGGVISYGGALVYGSAGGAP